jgi:hypothetical protein
MSVTWNDFSMFLLASCSGGLNLSRLVLAVVFNMPAAADHFLVSILLLQEGSPLAASSVRMDLLAPELTRDLTILHLVCLFLLPVLHCVFTNRIRRLDSLALRTSSESDCLCRF